MWTGALRQPLSRGAERVCRLATVPRFATFEGSASDPVALMEPLSLSELSGDLFFRSVAGNPATWEITDGRCLQAGHGRALPEALTLLREVDMRRRGFLSAALVSKASECFLGVCRCIRDHQTRRHVYEGSPKERAGLTEEIYGGIAE